MNEITLGCLARDVVTGFEGIVTAEVNYLSGCKQFCLTPRAKDGKTVDSAYFDFQRLEKIGGGVTLPSRPTGGSTADAPPAMEQH